MHTYLSQLYTLLSNISPYFNTNLSLFISVPLYSPLTIIFSSYHISFDNILSTCYHPLIIYQFRSHSQSLYHLPYSFSSPLLLFVHHNTIITTPNISLSYFIHTILPLFCPSSILIPLQLPRRHSRTG